MARKFITAVLSEAELKTLRKKTFLERNKIIQDELTKQQKTRIINLRMVKSRKKFIF